MADTPALTNKCQEGAAGHGQASAGTVITVDGLRKTYGMAGATGRGWAGWRRSGDAMR